MLLMVKMMVTIAIITLIKAILITSDSSPKREQEV